MRALIAFIGVRASEHFSIYQSTSTISLTAAQMKLAQASVPRACRNKIDLRVLLTIFCGLASYVALLATIVGDTVVVGRVLRTIFFTNAVNNSRMR